MECGSAAHCAQANDHSIALRSHRRNSSFRAPARRARHVPSLFDERGALANGATREFLQRFLGAFAAWIERTAPR
jgi:hypothetical protein